MYVERKQIHVERMLFATRQMLMLYVNANLGLRETKRQASVKVMYNKFFSYCNSQPIASSVTTALFTGLMG